MPALYKDPRPLDFANFGTRGLKRTATLSYARANSLPLMASEFQFAQMSYPIIFVGDPMMPVAVFGFQNNENLFLSPDGKWDEDAYVPAYVRRYPFVLAELPNDDRRFLCADFAAEAITDKNPDIAFFTADGKPTEAVNQALEFCRTFQEDVMMTQAFCAELKSHKLLKEAELRFNLPDGTQQGAGTFTSIEISALDALPDAVLLDLRKRGLLALMYLQQTSLHNWGQLNARRERMQGTVAANNR
jgi:hypothetical protein